MTPVHVCPTTTYHQGMNTTNAPVMVEGLRERRKATGLTRAVVAERCGCSLAYLQLLENGYTPRFSDVLPRIEQVLAEALSERA